MFNHLEKYYIEKASLFFGIFYSESDSEDESRQGFNLQEKLMSTKFPKYREYFIKELLGEEVDLAYFQR